MIYKNLILLLLNLIFLDKVFSEILKTFPFEIKRIQGRVHENIVKDFLGQPDGIVEVGPEKWIMPTSYIKDAEKIYNFEARSDDVFITTFPRSGTTWASEMIWLLCNDLDYKTASNDSTEKFTFLE